MLAAARRLSYYLRVEMKTFIIELMLLHREFFIACALDRLAKVFISTVVEVIELTLERREIFIACVLDINVICQHR